MYFKFKFKHVFAQQKLSGEKGTNIVHEFKLKCKFYSHTDTHTCMVNSGIVLASVQNGTYERFECTNEIMANKSYRLRRQKRERDG